MRNARLAGITFLLYIATAVTDMFLYAHATSGTGMAAKLASIAHHALEVRLAIVLAIFKILYALILAVALYALTRDVDRDLALLAFGCRVVEGVMNAVPATVRLGLLSIATAGPAATAADAAGQQSQAALLLNVARWSAAVGGAVFAMGSALFAYLFLRGRSIPASLAGLGVIGSLLVVPLFPLEGMQLVGSTVGWLTSIPILGFEVGLAFWLLIKGVSPQSAGVRQ